jgi:hypothetical protein
MQGSCVEARLVVMRDAGVGASAKVDWWKNRRRCGVWGTVNQSESNQIKPFW